MQIQQLKAEMQTIVADLQAQMDLHPGNVFVVGCSTSEIAGETIGTSGTEEVAAIIFEEMKKYADDLGIHLAFQCCEHLNRALVIERTVMNEERLEEVSVVPVREAGGAMATFAYNHFADPVVVEMIEANAVIDIGDTLIGMHLKRVAVPVRLSIHTLGAAHLTVAKTRPQSTGGQCANYKN